MKAFCIGDKGLCLLPIHTIFTFFCLLFQMAEGAMMMDVCLKKLKALFQMLEQPHRQLTLADFKEALRSLTGRITHLPTTAMERLLFFFDEEPGIRQKCMLLALDYWAQNGIVMHLKGGLQMQRVELVKAITYGVYDRDDINIDWEKLEPKSKAQPSFLEQAQAMEGSKEDPSEDPSHLETVHFLSSEEDWESHGCTVYCFRDDGKDGQDQEGDAKDDQRTDLEFLLQFRKVVEYFVDPLAPPIDWENLEDGSDQASNKKKRKV